MLRLEGEREPVDDGAEDLEEFSDAIEVLRLVDEPDCRRQQTANVKYLHTIPKSFSKEFSFSSRQWQKQIEYSLQEKVDDLFPDERSQPEELAVDSVQHGLEEVPLARVLRERKKYISVFEYAAK